MITKIFNIGKYQAVKMPKEYRLECKEVVVSRIGDVVVLLPEGSKWDGFVAALNMFSEDFFSEGRAKEYPQKREAF